MNLPSSAIGSPLELFAEIKSVNGNKGPIAALLVINRQALDRQKSGSLTWPLNNNDWKTGKQGQVKGLGGAATQKILNEYGITRVLASEGGRTSRGSMQLMIDYIDLLNQQQKINGDIDLYEYEFFWVSKAREFFERKPFVLSIDPQWGTRRAIRHILLQAQNRQNEGAGTKFVGSLMQHMVGAKLEVLLGKGCITHHHSNQNDSGSSRSGDFDFEDMSIHVTNMPSEALLAKCIINLDGGYKPLVITSSKGALVLEAMLENSRNGAYDGRVDILEFEQFLASNVIELGKFNAAGRKATLHRIIEEYNHIIETVELDLSMKIELGEK
ncbi:DUF4928 family protein [Serratia plymuthica]|uniref:DUF4928 family protein n=1 Tax=Serratia plymuthica TaxID=82996 RepID=A0A2X4TTE1_SERPL|nr:DUF4928 family protein [Serratia plymuthica]QPS22669.1 DUF4928 family protein [Serratia plymuthica]QPS64279.1 DUF4928 family protein [Serratia plymuthica]RKS63307.1 uncharacterized protein DUF4928 [Serratia plymuthica]CAI2407087.1 Uncharacterised protein [Serratia plymuthica]SQI30697.1 Uncharacterised protein [Serratia plymuthica]